MTPPTFHIGDEVVIIGPTVAGHCDFTGHKFKIDCECHGTYTGKGYTWYPAGSLRLVEELEIGDYVEVIGSPKGMSEYPIGQIGKITGIGPQGGFWVENMMKFYDSSALRKLTSEEVNQLTQPVAVVPTIESNAKRLDVHREEIDVANERLSAIEKKIAQFDGEIGHLHGSISECLIESGDVEARTLYREQKIAKRLDFIEAFQKDQRPVYTTYTYKPDDCDHGVITLHCSCGRKHEIEATPHKTKSYMECFMEGTRVDESESHNGTIRMLISQDGCPDLDRVFVGWSRLDCMEWVKEVLDLMEKGGLRT